MLVLRDIHKTFNPGTINEKKALQGVSLELHEGDFVTVIGGNGAGKSTMLNAIAGVWPVDAGAIEIDGEDVTGLPDFRRQLAACTRRGYRRNAGRKSGKEAAPEDSGQTFRGLRREPHDSICNHR